MKIVLVTFFIAVITVLFSYYVDGDPDRILEGREENKTVEKVGQDTYLKELTARFDEVGIPGQEFIKKENLELGLSQYLDFLHLRNSSLKDILEEVKLNYSFIKPPGTVPEDKRLRAKLYLNVVFSILEKGKLKKKVQALHPDDRNRVERYNTGVVGLGVEKFMTTAVQFCAEEAPKETIEIISVGSGNGLIERDIVATYRERLKQDLRITLIESDPQYEADFKTVDALIEKRPTVVGNCILFVIWPRFANTSKNNIHDTDAIFKLQPRAVITLYQTTAYTGSPSFRAFLHEDSLNDLSPREYGIRNWEYQFQLTQVNPISVLNNYLVKEIAREKFWIGPISGSTMVRLVKLKRVFEVKPNFDNGTQFGALPAFSTL